MPLRNFHKSTTRIRNNREINIHEMNEHDIRSLANRIVVHGGGQQQTVDDTRDHRHQGHGAIEILREDDIHRSMNAEES